ncbi:MAG: DUF3160 domain-containing protein [Candidatus Aureabacteria bacterium]|nr:DUF3160 domain-containing protein [Candidatus Auribacterota bacterium]
MGNRFFKEMLKVHDQDLKSLWERLAELCQHLATLSNKQLRGIPFNKNDEDYLGSVGKNLAGIMLYGGNSYANPRDDSPRIVDVHYAANKRKYLEVGISRPRVIYVLYPWKGVEILCRGAVLPYYEFASDARLNDKEWKTMLDSDKRPKQPEWLKPLVEEKGILTPDFESAE